MRIIPDPVPIRATPRDLLIVATHLISPKAASLAFKLGIPVTNTSRWETDPAKLLDLLERVSRSISAYRLGDKKSMLALRG